MKKRKPFSVGASTPIKESCIDCGQKFDEKKGNVHMLGGAPWHMPCFSSTTKEHHEEAEQKFKARQKNKGEN